MSSLPKPTVVRPKKSLPLIWIVPLLALFVGGWLIYRSLRDHGPEIVLQFENGSGIEAGKTILEHKGVAVGTVKSVQLDREMQGVLVTVNLAKDAASLARVGSEFWLVRPEIGFSGIRGLDTLLTGARLKVRPGTGEPASTFVALKKTPLLESSDRGRSFILRSPKLGALTPGAPVYFREIKVGFIETHRLSQNSDGVIIRLRIRAPYDQLVRAETKFWNAGGVAVKVGLLGAEIRSNSLESLLSGGVAFATPETAASSPAAADGSEFELHDEGDKDWLKWKTNIPVVEATEGWETSTPLADPAS